MRKILFYSFLLLLFSVKSYSDESNLRNDLKAYKSSLHIDKTGAKYFVKVTFNNIPLQSEFEEIETKGIKFLDYVPRNAYYCSIDSKVITEDLKKYGIISIDTIPLENKISSELIEGIPDWMESIEGKVKLNIEYFKGIKDYETLKLSLAGLDAEILEHYEYFNRFYIRISFDKLRELASLPWVMYVDTDNKPLTTENYQAGQSHVANALRLENSLGGRGLTGEGVKIGIFDDGAIGQHIDLDNRVTQVYQGNYGEHATHCLGTIAGAGKININASGMAPRSDLFSWSIYGDNILNAMLQGINDYGITINSNSWGILYGKTCGQIGKYDSYSRGVDKLTLDSSYLLQMFAAGNDAASCLNGWNTVMSGYNSSKNIITVGAIDISNIIASFSSRGPLIDGRLKPEITSVGKSVYSTAGKNSYFYDEGTSMATPGVTGTVALLYERFMQLNNNAKPDASLIKGIVCNTADDLGNIGPDYIYGYGKINGLRAVRVIEQGNYYSNNISQSNTQTQSIAIPSNTGQLRVTLCWSDKEALANANPAIVNNLDLKVTINGTDYNPWVLNPSNPSALASRGIDSLNVVEFVSIDNPNQGNCTICVAGMAVPFGPQKYFVAYEFVNKGVELTYPLAKDRITPNEQQILRWNSFGLIDSVSIELSTNNGLNWTLVSKVPNNQLYYNWTPSSSQCTGQAKIRLSSGNYSFIMDSTFSIFPQPANFALTTGDDESLNMQWNPVANATGYEVMKLNNDFEWEVLDTTTLTSYNVSGLVDFNSYWLTLVALGSNGAKSQRLPAKSCQVITAYHTPRLHLPSDGEWSVELTPTFRWIKLRDSVNYQIQVSTSNQFSQLVSNSITNDSLFTCDSLEYSTEYFWRARAMKQNDTTEWSEIWQFTTKDDPALVINENSSGNTLWAWGDNSQVNLGFYEYSKPSLQSNKKWNSITTNGNNSFGIDSAGHLWAWGKGGGNGDGTQTTHFIPIQIGMFEWKKTTCQHAIRTDGTLWGWGLNTSGQIGDSTTQNRLFMVQIGNDTNWKDVSTGYNHSIAIKTDGSLWAWGNNERGQIGDSTTQLRTFPIRVTSLSNVKMIFAGKFSSYAIKEDGTLYSWGLNHYGQLGTSNSINSSFPVRVGNDTNWSQISTGEYSVLAIKSDSSLWCWGSAGSNNGDSSSVFMRNSPARIGYSNDWATISISKFYTLATKCDGSVWNWGVNSWDVFSNPNVTETYYPIKNGEFSNARIAVSSSSYCSMVLTTDSLLYVWGGNNTNGELGLENFKRFYCFPQKHNKLTGLRSIHSKYQHSLFNNNSNNIYVFGVNDPWYTIGIPKKELQPATPVKLAEIKLKKAFLGTSHNFILNSMHSMYVWGTNDYGCFGNGTTSNVLVRTPIPSTLENTFSTISSGISSFSIGIKSNGTIWGWGYNAFGQLGNNSTNQSEIPIQITPTCDWKTVACGFFHTVAIKEDGSLWAWGRNDFGQLGDSSYVDKLVPTRIGNSYDWDSVACGSKFTIAQRNDGTLWAWGQNHLGQLGLGDYTYRNYPVQISNSSNWNSFACGNEHTLAIKDDGTLWSWGWNNKGQLGDSSTANRNYPVQIGNKTDWIKIAAGNSTSFAICSPSGFVAPTLVMPSYNKRISNSDTIFVWNSVEDATKYQFQLGYDTLFTSSILNISTADTTRPFPQFASEGVYFWRVRAMNDYDTTAWSEIWKYRISDFDLQNIPLTSGWNMISSYLTPQNLAMSSVLSPIASNLILLKNLYAQIYAPPFQTTLTNWNTFHAYQLRNQGAATLPITGIQITPETTPILLNQLGWYWLPYYRTTNMPPATALNSINGKYLQVKTITGLVYQPPFFNTLQNLQPGLGYNIRITQSGTLTYPANTIIKSASDKDFSIEEPKVFARERNITGKTAVIAMDLQDVSFGDEVGVFTRDGMLVGSSVWQEGLRGVVVWGDDEFTNEKDGASEGEELIIKVWSKADNNIGDIIQISLDDMATNTNSFTLKYETDAIHLLKGRAEYVGKNLSISPQPASDELYINLSEKVDGVVNIKVYNQAGQIAIDTDMQTNNGILKLSTTTLPSGVYQIVINTNGKVYSEKIVIIR